MYRFRSGSLAKVPEKDNDDCVIEVSRHGGIRNVPFELRVTTPTKKKDVIIILSAVVPNGKDMVTCHADNTTTGGTFLCWSHSFLPHQIPRKNAPQTASVPNILLSFLEPEYLGDVECWYENIVRHATVTTFVMNRSVFEHKVFA